MTDLRESLGSDELDALQFKRNTPNGDRIREVICALGHDLGGHGAGVLRIGVAKDGTPYKLDARKSMFGLRAVDGALDRQGGS